MPGFIPDIRMMSQQGTFSPQMLQSFLPGFLGGSSGQNKFNPLGSPFGPGGTWGPMGQNDPIKQIFGSFGGK